MGGPYYKMTGRTQTQTLKESYEDKETDHLQTKNKTSQKKPTVMAP